MSTSDGSTKPLDVQVGGDHYKSMAIQPMEYSMANKLDACQHTIIKYVTRFREKGGIQDLEKAKHCIDLLIHFERQVTALPTEFGQQNMIDPADVEISEQPAKCNGCYAGCRDCCPGLAKIADEKLARMRAASAERFVNEVYDLLVEPASAIDDSSERMQAIGQNGNNGEHYDSERPSFAFAPPWANWVAQDKNGEWTYFEGMPAPFANGWASSSRNVVISQCRCELPGNNDWASTLTARPVK